jgi:hypothetical protein
LRAQATEQPISSKRLRVMGGIVRQKGCITKPNKVLLRNQIDGRRLVASLILLFFIALA